jgi:Domain of unknown function (DUF4349)
MRTKVGLSLCVVALLLTGAACSHSNAAKSEAANSGAMPAPSRGSGVADNGTPTAPSGTAPSNVVDFATVKQDDRRLIHNATDQMQAPDVDAALNRVTTAVQQAGGDLVSADAELADPRARHIHAAFEVPPEHFDAVLHMLPTIGKILSNQVSTQDVTGQVVDLDARLAAARTSADRLRGLLAQSANVNDLLSVEQALSQRESEVESLTAQDNAIKGQVAHATITLDIAPEPAPVPKPPAPHHGHPSFGAGLGTGVSAFVGGGEAVLAAFGFLLPFLALAALVGGFVLVLRRRRPHAERAAHTL